MRRLNEHRLLPISRCPKRSTYEPRLCKNYNPARHHLQFMKASVQSSACKMSPGDLFNVGTSVAWFVSMPRREL